LRSVCGELIEAVEWSVWDKALAAGGKSWMKRMLDAASEFPSYLDLTDEEEDPDSPTAQAQEKFFPPHHPWRRMIHSLKK
jgi:hypothetical protein